jgi:hypothetical protein
VTELSFSCAVVERKGSAAPTRPTDPTPRTKVCSSCPKSSISIFAAPDTILDRDALLAKQSEEIQSINHHKQLRLLLLLLRFLLFSPCCCRWRCSVLPMASCPSLSSVAPFVLSLPPLLRPRARSHISLGDRAAKLIVLLSASLVARPPSTSPRRQLRRAKPRHAFQGCLIRRPEVPPFRNPGSFVASRRQTGSSLPLLGQREREREISDEEASSAAASSILPTRYAAGGSPGRTGARCVDSRLRSRRR